MKMRVTATRCDPARFRMLEEKDVKFRSGHDADDAGEKKT